VGRTHQTADWQIEAGRAVLPLIVAVWNERPDLIWLPYVSQHVCHDAIDLGISSPALLVGQASTIAEARKNEAMGDPPDLMLVERKPGQRSDRAGDKKKSISVVRLKFPNVSRQHRCNRDPREIVVGQRRMAHVAGDKDRVAGSSRNQQLSKAEMAGREL